jgi:hypothetical protein
LTPDQRASAENGIHLCNTCSRLIDGDPDIYTVGDNQFTDHPPLRRFANEIDAQRFDSGWVPLDRVEAKRTHHVWMVRSPEDRGRFNR